MSKQFIAHIYKKGVFKILPFLIVVFFFSLFLVKTAQAAVVSNVAIADSDTAGYGVDGRDFTVTWNVEASAPAGYQFTQVYIVSSSINLTTSTLGSACGGFCTPLGVYNQYSIATHTLPQSAKADSANASFATSTQYVAWIYVNASTPTLVSSTVLFSPTFDVIADVNKPQIMHIGVHTAKASTLAVVNAFVVDDQTNAAQFETPTGVEYFRLKYGSNVSVSESSVDATAVSGASGLFSFSIPTSSIPAAGNTLQYYLMANDASGNLRVFCANPNALTAADCKTSPLIINTVTISGAGRTVSGTVFSMGSGLGSAKVFPAGFALAPVTTNASGTYAISGLPNNDGIDFTAYKTGFINASRMETIGSSDKTGVDLNLASGLLSYVSQTGGSAGGGAPHVVFSGPPDGMQNVPNNVSLRVGFDQPMDATTVNDSDATDMGSRIYLTTDSGSTKVAGSVLYCTNSSALGCSSLMSIDNNVILFTPASNLNTSTFYTLVIGSDVKSQGGQSIQGNLPGGGHKISFTTIGNTFSGQFSASQWQTNFNQGGQFLPPFIKSMMPAPGMAGAPNTKILLEFNAAMDASTVNSSNITLWLGATQITSGVTVSLDSNEKVFVTIDHSNLASGEYQVKVGGAVTSASGVPMRPNSSDIAFSSKFNVVGSVDATAATIYPVLANNSTGVATDKVFEFGFNEPLSVGSVNSSNISLKRGSTSDSLTVKYNPGKNSVYIVPSSVLSPNTIYTITFSPSVSDLAGNGLATTSYTYTTGAVDSNSPGIKDARCDDYACRVMFSKQVIYDSQVGSKWSSSVINPSNIVLEKTAPSSGVISLTGKSIGYDPVNFTLSLSGLSGLTAGDSFRVTVSSTVKDISENLISTSSNQNIFNGKVEDSKTTFGQFGDVNMFAPPTTGLTGGATIGTAEFKPQGFGSFTADQFALGQADMAFPFNPMAGVDSNVFQVRFTPGVAVQTGDIVNITFPDGFNVANAALDAQSPFYSDFNQFMTGMVSSTAITVANGLNQVSVTLGVSGSPSASDPLTIDLKKIINSSVPKSPQTGGYTVGIKIYRSSASIANKTTMPFFIMTAGSNTLVVDVVAGSSTSSPTNGANGTVYIHGGGPGGPMEKKLTMTNGDISAVDGTAGTAVTYSSLPDGCYFVGTDPFVTLGSNDYFGQMAPEPVCLSSGETKTKWMLLTSASGGSTATLTVKMVDSNGDPYNFGGKDIDIFAGGPNKFVVKNLTSVAAAATNGYNLKLNANGHWFVGMGPGMAKGASTAKPTSLGVMPPPPVDILVQNIDSSPTLSLGTGNPPPGVSYSNGVITFTFATADKTVTGTVKDGSGNALANVEVFMHRQGFGAPVFTQTNASGVFSLSVSNFGNYEIGAMSDGMPPVMKNIELRSDDKIYVDGKDVTGNFILNLKKASYTISGKVLNGSNNGIAYAPVMAVDANGNAVFGQSSSDGSYTLFVDNGTWTVRAELPQSKTDSCGSFSKVVTVSGSSQASQNLTSSASSCYTLSGTVSVGGTALANIPVFIEQWSSATGKPTIGGERKNVSTDSNGAYSVKVAGDTTYRVAAWHSDYGELSATSTVTGNTTQNLTVATTENITFSFTGGTSAMNAFIELKNSSDSNKRISRQLTGLNNSATFSVPAGSTHSYFLDVFGIGKFQGTVVASSTETVNLGSSADYITVTGTIYVGSNTSTGQSGALVTLSNATTTVSAVTDSNGQYSVRLKAGTYNISDSLFGYISTKGTNVSFTTNTSAYDFGGSSPDQSALATAGYNIEGTVYASDGSTAMTDGYVWGTNASGTIVNARVKSTDGTYSLPVANGVWTIKAVGPRHVETTRSGTVTVSGANQTAKNITLTAATAGENVPTSTAGVIAADTGGSLNDSGGSGMKLTAGAGVLETGSSEVTVNFEKNYTAPDTSNYGALGNASFSISASGDSTIKNLSGNAEIQIDYTSLLSSLPADISESDLKLTYYSEEKGDYVPVEGGFTIDTSTNKITGLVNHFTDFVIAYTATSSNSPSAPTGLSATAASASQINLSWTAVSGATSYTVYRSTDNVTYSSIATASTNSYNNTGLSASTLYYYKVTASNSFGEGSSSSATSATTNSVGGGSGGSAGGSSYSAPVTATTTAVTATTTPSVTSTVSSATTSVSSGAATTTVSVIEKKPVVEVIKTGGTITVLNPQSKIVITLPKVASYQPGAQITFAYKYQNESVKKMSMKVVRQLLDSKGKVLKTSSLPKSLKSKAVFTSNVKENLLKNLKPGDYTVKIMILGAKNKVIDQNSFKIEIEKAKQKYFIFGSELPEATNIAFDEESFAKVKSDIQLPTQLKLKYRYANDSDVKQKVRMVRQLIDPSGKVMQTNTGNWSMEPGEEDEQTFTQPIVPKFVAGAYKIRLRAYDFKTKELLAENSVGFSIELR